MRLLGFSDIHGCHHTFDTLLNKVNPTMDDTMVFCGDFIDRGWGRSKDVSTFLYNGGDQTLDSYKRNTGVALREFSDLPEKHQLFFKSLVPFHIKGDFLFVHAGLRPGYNMDEQTEHDMIWIRDTFLWDEVFDFYGKTVVHGHTWMPPDALNAYNTKHQGRRVNLDSGCVYGHHLTCVDLLSKTEWKEPFHRYEDKEMAYEKDWM